MNEIIEKIKPVIIDPTAVMKILKNVGWSFEIVSSDVIPRFDIIDDRLKITGDSLYLSNHSSSRNKPATQSLKFPVHSVDMMTVARIDKSDYDNLPLMTDDLGFIDFENTVYLSDVNTEYRRLEIVNATLESLKGVYKDCKSIHIEKTYGVKSLEDISHLKFKQCTVYNQADTWSLKGLPDSDEYRFNNVKFRTGVLTIFLIEDFLKKLYSINSYSQEFYIAWKSLQDGKTIYDAAAELISEGYEEAALL